MAEPSKTPAPPPQAGTPPTPRPTPPPAGKELDADQLQGIVGGAGRRDGLS
ncbi:hypothetical protein [Teichococcus cervicalis]|nr:hypothetical protein [Pseudoroseomonas cervicalis]